MPLGHLWTRDHRLFHVDFLLEPRGHCNSQRVHLQVVHRWEG
jgi:hypothetical protein